MKISYLLTAVFFAGSVQAITPQHLRAIRCQLEQGKWNSVTHAYRWKVLKSAPFLSGAFSVPSQIDGLTESLGENTPPSETQYLCNTFTFSHLADGTVEVIAVTKEPKQLSKLPCSQIPYEDTNGIEEYTFSVSPGQSVISYYRSYQPNGNSSLRSQLTYFTTELELPKMTSKAIQAKCVERANAVPFDDLDDPLHPYIP